MRSNINTPLPNKVENASEIIEAHMRVLHDLQFQIQNFD